MVCDAVRPQTPQLWVQVDVMRCYKPELLANDILSKANAQYGIVHGVLQTSRNTLSPSEARYRSYWARRCSRS